MNESKKIKNFTTAFSQRLKIFALKKQTKVMNNIFLIESYSVTLKINVDTIRDGNAAIIGGEGIEEKDSNDEEENPLDKKLRELGFHSIIV